jgi:hypothetical protein
MADYIGPLDLSSRPSAKVVQPSPQRPPATANERSAARLVEEGEPPQPVSASPGTEPSVGKALDAAGLPNLQGEVRTVSPSSSAGADPTDPMEGAGNARVREISGSSPGPRPMPGAWRERTGG